MKYQFEAWRPQKKTAIVLDLANDLIKEYQREGYDLTVRQLYYQFIARDLFPDDWLVKIQGGQLTKNTEENYRKLGTILTKGRMAGMIDWDAIVDRTRKVTEWKHHSDPKSAIHGLAQEYCLDPWKEQTTAVEIWVEKEALVGVFHKLTQRYTVPLFACRGYLSISAAHEAADRLRDRFHGHGQKTTILHFGDHDPSGLDMTRDIKEKLETFLVAGVQVKRVSLNIDQVKAFNPPPSPAKETDTRAKKYIAEFGEDSWELDSISPTELVALAEKEILSQIERAKWETTAQQQKKDYETLLALAT